MKPNVIFEILFLILIGNLNQHVAGQSSLSLDLHKQSQRTKQAAQAAGSKRHIDSAHNLKSLRLKRHSSPNKKQARQLEHNGDNSATNSANLPIRFVDFEDPTGSSFNLQTTTTPAAPVSNGHLQTPSSDISALQTTSQPEASLSSSKITTTTASSSTKSQPNYELSSAELCYLANGGSSLTLTVNEATQVGSLIGTIDVSGDPALEGGNVDLEVEGAGDSQQVDHSTRLIPTSSTTGQEFAASTRQMRRLLGRRDTATTSENSSSPALRLEPGSRDLVLARPLDKESVEGEAGLLVNVRCRPRPAPDHDGLPNSLRSKSSRPQASTIPVRLIVTDANDHAPQFLGQQPYVINISETTPAGSPVGSARDIQAVDRDSAGPHSTVLYSVLEHSGAPLGASANSASQQQLDAFANLSHHFAFSNPLEPQLWLISPLDYDNLPAPYFTITILAQDQAEPEPLQSQAQVQINVLDFDDQNPRFLDEKYTLVMDELQSSLVGQPLRVLPRQLHAEDGDRGIGAPILYSFDSQTSNTFFATSRLLGAFGSTGDAAASANLVTTSSTRPDPTSDDELLLNIDSYLHLNSANGEVRLLRQWPRHKWPTGAGPLTVVVRAAQADNRDRYALTTLTITPRAATLNSTHLLDAGRPPGSNTAPDQRRYGISFQRDEMFVRVPEDTPVNEKLVQVRAYHLDESPSSAEQQPADAPAGQRLGLFSVADQTAKRSGRLPVGNKTSEKRPISYQLLDDQMDQFGINALGEIFLKRPLDFEQRQEFRLRVLASYTKHSDICQVHLAVTNVNDNKPKFTHSQYSFHLTESRLRSNLIGTVQAHDADLNDTLEYSILTDGPQSKPQDQQCARLFEFANPTLGQLSLKMGIRQLNVSQCQLVVQASDSLGPASERHHQQARVSINIAAQIIGRSINLFATTAARPLHQAADHLHQSRRSGDQRDKTSTGDLGEFSTASNVIVHYQTTGGATSASGQSNQRSSLATVMASLQHMAKGLNLLEMPMSSALLLSVLLAFLVCLLLIVVVSMTVHVYRRRTKSRRRRHLAATAHLRHAHMAAVADASRSPISPYKTSSSSYTNTTSASPGSHSSASSVNSGHLQQQQQQAARSGNYGNSASRKQNFFDNLGLASSVVELANRHHKSNLNVQLSEDEPNANTNDTSLTTDGSANANGSPTPAGDQSDLQADTQNGNKQLLDELKISTELEPVGGKGKPAAGTYVKSTTETSLKTNPNSLVSSLTTSGGQSKANSYLGANSALSTDEDDSSVIQCGHYSVNNTIKHRQRQADNHKQLDASSGTGETQRQPRETEACRRGHTNRLLDEIHSELVRQQKQVMRAPTVARKRKDQQRHQVGSSIEAAIRHLAHQEQAVDDGDDNANCSPAGPRLANKFKVLNNEEINEVPVLTSSGKPGIKSYRQLPLMNSLVRPVRSQLFSLADRKKVAPEQTSGQQIRWPSGAFPQRIKRLTWDDELSCCPDADSLDRRDLHSGELEAASDCYISTDVQLAGPISPLGPDHNYGAAGAHRPSEYLYSPSSQQSVPRPNYSDYLPPLNGQSEEQTSGSRSNLNNRNNCLDYTIVQTSQFHADSLMASTAAINSSTSNTIESNQPGDYLYSNHEAPSEHYYYEQATMQNKRTGSRNQTLSPTRESVQTGATYKLNQNYQDLKLMTTVVL